MTPTISVIIPTYNRLPLLREALQSVAVQTLPVHEIIVVDDGSTDGTEEALAASAPPLRYVRQPNAGPAAARNRGFSLATGEWIALLDSDDLWLKDKLTAQIDFISHHPTLDFVFGNQVNQRDDHRDDDPEILNKEIYYRMRQRPAPVTDFFALLLEVNPVPTSSVIFRKSCLSITGLLDESRWRCEDYDLWFRFAANCHVGYLDRNLVAKRAQHDNLINDYKKMWTAHLEVLQALPEANPRMTAQHFRLWNRAIAATIYRLGSFEYKHGSRRNAKKLFADLELYHLPSFSRAQAAATVKWALTRLS